jgi:hypothetical protein
LADEAGALVAGAGAVVAGGGVGVVTGACAGAEWRGWAAAAGLVAACCAVAAVPQPAARTASSAAPAADRMKVSDMVGPFGLREREAAVAVLAPVLRARA